MRLYYSDKKAAKKSYQHNRMQNTDEIHIKHDSEEIEYLIVRHDRENDELVVIHHDTTLAESQEGRQVFRLPPSSKRSK